MSLREIWSGCQTGADRGALEAAAACSIPTGGWVPLNNRQQDGRRTDLIKLFGLKETNSEGYRERTILNVRDTDGTLWIGNPGSPGGKLTCGEATRSKKPLLKVKYRGEFAMTNLNLLQCLAEEISVWVNCYEIARLNVAGNRENTNPGIQEFTKNLIITVIQLVKEEPRHEQQG